MIDAMKLKFSQQESEVCKLGIWQVELARVPVVLASRVERHLRKSKSCKIIIEWFNFEVIKLIQNRNNFSSRFIRREIVSKSI